MKIADSYLITKSEAAIVKKREHVSIHEPQSKLRSYLTKLS